MGVGRAETELLTPTQPAPLKVPANCSPDHCDPDGHPRPSVPRAAALDTDTPIPPGTTGKGGSSETPPPQGASRLWM